MTARRAPNYAIPAALAVLASQFSNAFGAAWSKSLFAAVGPEGIVALRLGFGALLLVLLTRAWRIRVARDQIGNLAAYGVALGVMNSVAYQAYARIPVGIGMAIEVTGPLTLVILQSRRPTDFGWIACTIVGLGFLLFHDTGLPTVNPVGIAFAFCSAASWAGYIVFGKRVSAWGGGNVVAIGMTIAAILAVPVGISTAGATLLEPKWLGVGAAIAVLSSAFPFFLQMFALRQLPVRIFGLVASAVPAVGATMGFVVLGEALRLRQCLGILLVVVASAGCTLSLARAERSLTASRVTPPERG